MSDQDQEQPPHPADSGGIEDQLAAAILGDGGEFFVAAETPNPASDGGPQKRAGEGADDFDETDVPPPAAGDPVLGDDDRDLAEAVARCTPEPQNDTGNGKRLLAHFGDALLHVRKVGWHQWTGSHWNSEGGDEAATRSAQVTAERIAFEAAFLANSKAELEAIEAGDAADDELAKLDKIKEPTDDQKRKMRQLRAVSDDGAEAKAALTGRKNSRRKYAISSGNAGKIRGMIDQALPHKTVVTDALNPDKLAFNVRNGTLRFHQVEIDDPDGTEATGFKRKVWRVRLDPHSRADLITKIAPVEYDAKAMCPTFDASLKRFQPHEAVRKFLLRYHGYALTGLIGEQCFIFNFGLGSNWKSTFVEMVCRVLGDYAATLDFKSLSGENQGSGSQASPDLARLPGARLVRASEPERGVQFKEALIKSLTGGEPMLVRHNFKDFFEFKPDFKLTLSGNHKPQISGVDHGIWRRIKFVRWPVTIRDDEKRPFDDVIAELMPELPGILNLLIAGALDYLNHGLQVPAEVDEATAEYREESDPVGNFIADCVESVAMNADGSPASSVPAREMFAAFEAWGQHNAIKTWKEKAFAEAMRDKGFEKKKKETGRIYLHVRLHDVPTIKTNRRDEPPHPADADDDEIPA